MLKITVSAVTLMAITSTLLAKDIQADIGHDGHTDHILVSQKADNSGVVSFFEDGKQIGTFNNLIVNQSSISSDVIQIAGGGIAIVGDSNGSRSKYHTITPIHREGNRLYTDCTYKSIYDSVDETRSAGALCHKDDLSKFNLSDVINDKGVISYDDSPSWIGSLHLKDCQNPAGFSYGNYYVARCSAEGAGDLKKSQVNVATKKGDILFSIKGYEFYPKEDGKFFLGVDLYDQIVEFEGSLSCMEHAHDTNTETLKATIGGKFPIIYKLASDAGCLGGTYSYVSKNIPISLTGTKTGNISYLMEINKDKSVSGLFILQSLAPNLNGIWVASPPKNPLAIK